jgi:uncharacterized membrane protein YebE (DUF533 family)
MIIKLAALGTLGYFGYRYYEQNKEKFAMRGRGDSDLALAGGPLSDHARIESSDTPTEDWPSLDPRNS